MKTTIVITAITTTKRIPVAVSFSTYLAGESYRQQMSRVRNFELRKSQGFVKQYYPEWYKNIMVTKRNQTVSEVK